jgi:uncharacterized membrane protein
MAAQTFLVYTGVYDHVDDALADYEAVKELHGRHGLIEAYDAAVVERRDDGKVKIRKKHETPTRAGGVGGGVFGLATGLVVALFPAAAIGEGIILATTGTGAVLGALAGHAAGGMSRNDLKEIGEQLDAGQAGLVVVAVGEVQTEVESTMEKARSVESKELRADPGKIEADAKEAEAQTNAATS